MVTLKSVEAQLKRIHFNHSGWNHAEALELPNILIDGEVIYECVNGTYEGGIALLVATNVRLLLVDKKPMKFLTVEDLRFDMINQIDYSHRMFGASITVSAGSKNLTFKSFNQQRLRKAIGHVQHCMAEAKKTQTHAVESQQQHLEKINEQLQAYLLAQHQQQEELRKQLDEVRNQTVTSIPQPEPVKPSPQLADYLYAQRLLEEYESQHQGGALAAPSPIPTSAPSMAMNASAVKSTQVTSESRNSQLAELYTAGMQEIFGKKRRNTSQNPASPTENPVTQSSPLEINPLRIAYSKLPMVLRDRAFIRRSRASGRRLNEGAGSITTTPNPSTAASL